MKNKGSFRLNTYFSSEFPQISQKNGYLGIRFIKRAGNFWNGELLKKTDFVLSNEFWQHCQPARPVLRAMCRIAHADL